MTAQISYFTNTTDDQSRRFWDGWQTGDPVRYVGTIEAPEADPDDLAERAFMFFQRIDDPHPILDAAKAPSLSIGDLVRVVIGGTDTPAATTWLACEREGFRTLTADEVAALIIPTSN